MHLAELPDLRSAQNPESRCLSDDTTDLNAADFAVAVRRAATVLRAHEVSAGDVVAVMLPNNVALVIALFAAWRLGAAVTPINPSLVSTEVAYQISDSGAKVLVVENPQEYTDVAPSVLAPSDLAAAAAQPGEPVELSDDSLALLIYTSGTTGRPKGVMLDHANLNAMCAMVIDAFQLTADDHSLLILPLFHVNGIVVSTLAPLLVGGGAHHRRAVQPEDVLRSAGT